MTDIANIGDIWYDPGNQIHGIILGTQKTSNIEFLEMWIVQRNQYHWYPQDDFFYLEWSKVA